MKRLILLLFLSLLMEGVLAQKAEQKLTLHESYELLYRNYPVADKIAIQEKISELNRSIAKSGWYPELQISAGTSYQSDVTEVPFAAPGTDPPSFSHDHYNISVDLSQPIFDGGRTRSRIQLEEHTGETEQAKIQVELWNVRSQLNQIYFGILMMEKQEEILRLLLDDLRKQISMVEAQVRNGVLLKSDELVLKAEQIKTEQQIRQVQADLQAGFEVLGELLSADISEETILEVPGPMTGLPANGNNRAEYQLFEANRQTLNSQKKLAGADLLPTLSLFGKTAYGRPGLNAFDDDFQLYWIVGIRVQWSFKNSRNASGKTEILDLQQQNLSSDRDAFTRQLNASLIRAKKQIQALEDQLEQDEEILRLRAQIAGEKRSQLREGSITSTEYITELNAENRARLNLELRKIQRALAITEYQTELGISWK